MSKPNPKAKNYYERLGVSKGADFNQIRKAYMKCVRKYHPDHNQNLKDKGEAFKSIQEAYDCLSKEETRGIYDKYGEEGLKQQSGMGGFGGGGMDIFDLISGRGRRGGGRRGPPKCESVRQGLPVTLENIYNGFVRKIRVTRSRICKKCTGSGSRKAGESKECPTCKGSGVETRYAQIGPGFVTQMQQTCSRCRGEKRIINPKYICKTCNGQRVTQEKKTLEIHIDKGMRDGQKIVFEGEADEKPNLKAGDIIFILQERPHKTFKRDGNNLIINKKIKLVQALTGVEFVVETLDKRKLIVKSKPGEVIKHGAIKQIEGEGLPQYKRPYDKGNLILKFSVEFPDTIPKKFVEKLIEVLPKMEKVDVKKYKEVEEVTLEDPEETGGDQQHRRREVYDSDDEDEGRGGGGHVHTCAMQ